MKLQEIPTFFSWTPSHRKGINAQEDTGALKKLCISVYLISIYRIWLIKVKALPLIVGAQPAPKNLQGDHNLKKLVKYVARYLGRPCIGTSRIDSYDGKIVTFHYDAHIGKTGNATHRQSDTLPAVDFLLRLTQHIQEPHFVMVSVISSFPNTIVVLQQQE